MKIGTIIIFLIVSCLACANDREENSEAEKNIPDSAMVFDQAKWKTKDGKDYPYRESMLNDVVYNDTVRSLNKKEIFNLLGEPDRINENHLYYRIVEKRLGFWTLHNTSMVIKFSGDDTIDWIKIHGLK